MVGRKILYINLDDPYYSEVHKDPKNLYRIIEIAEKLTGEKTVYLFLDEIQNVRNWEKWVKSAYDSEIYKKIFVTGSNSNLLKSDYSGLLSGRYIIQEVFPFSYREILNNQGINDHLSLAESKSTVMSIIDNMLEYGGFPEVFKTIERELKRDIIVNYYDTIVLKDCISQGKIRDIKTFKELTHYIISNTTSLYSYNSLARVIDSNDGSIKEFLRIMEEAFLMYETNNYSFSLKHQIKGRKKIYCSDNGFLSNISFRFSANKGKLFENLVFTELKKRAYKIYFHNINKECDFIFSDEKNQKLRAIQVCFEINETNRKREIAGLKAVRTKLGINDGIILTYDQEEKVDGFTIIPFWKYFFWE